MQELVDSEEFYKNYVGEKMAAPLSQNDFNWHLATQRNCQSCHVKIDEFEPSYIYTPEQLQDVAALHAFNATLIRGSVDLAVALAGKSGRPVEQVGEVYGSEVFRGHFQDFVARLSDKMTREPTSSVRQNAKEIMGQIIAKL